MSTLEEIKEKQKGLNDLKQLLHRNIFIEKDTPLKQ